MAATPSHTIIAFLENARTHEVGVAVLSVEEGELVLMTLRDSAPLFFTSCGVASTASVVVVPAGSHGRCLAQALAAYRPVISARRLFNESAGLQAISRLCAVPPSRRDLQGTNAYLAVSAASAAIAHADSMGLSLTAGMARLVVRAPAAHVLLDAHTIDALELLHAGKRRSASVGGVFGSMSDALDTCKSVAGSRLLSGTLAMPISDSATLVARHVAVQELEEGLSGPVTCVLPSGRPVGAALLALGRPSTAGARRSISRGGAAVRIGTPALSALVALHGTLQACPQVAEALRPAKSALLQGIAEQLSSAAVVAALDLIANVYDPDGVDALTRQHCFGVREGVHPVVDAARAAFHSAVLELDAGTAAAGQGFRVTYSAAGGFALTGRLGKDTAVPPGFKRRGASVTGLPTGLGPAAARAETALSDACAAAEYVCCGLACDLAPFAAGLHAAGNALALLDMLAAFAAYSSRLRAAGLPVCYPSFEEGPVALKAMRPPLAELHGLAAGSLRFVPNDVLLGGALSVTLLFGDNSTGKSLYGAALAQCAVLAHTGCAVPAAFASFPPLRRIHMLQGTGGEVGGTTRDAELLATVLATATSQRHLVVADELFRGAGGATRPIQAELVLALAGRRVPSLIISHHRLLAHDLAGAKAVGSYHFAPRTLASIQAPFLLRRGPGSASVEFVNLGQAVGLPQRVLDRALNLPDGQNAESQHSLPHPSATPSGALQTPSTIRTPVHPPSAITDGLADFCPV